MHSTGIHDFVGLLQEQDVRSTRGDRSTNPCIRVYFDLMEGDQSL